MSNDLQPAQIKLLVDLFSSARYTEMEAQALCLVERYPQSGFAWKALGLSLTGQGKESLRCYAVAAALSPEDPEVHLNLGVALHESGQLDHAGAIFRHALRIKPEHSTAHNNLGNVLEDLGRPDAALACYRRALAFKPDFVDGHSNRGIAEQALGNLAEAVGCYRRALTLKPEFAKAINNLGRGLAEVGQLGDAIASYRHVLAIEPGDAVAQNNLGTALQDIGKVDEALTSYTRALLVNPSFAVAHSNLLFALNYLSDVANVKLLAEAQNYGEKMTPQAGPYTDWRNTPNAVRRLRVGLVSGDFWNHPVGYFVEGVLAALVSHASSRLELYAYYNHSRLDEKTEKIKACCREWRPVAGLADAVLARMIREDEIDILLDLSGHSAHNRLPVFACHPAPVQATWLGYLATTGVTAMDYLIADHWTIPESAETNYTEKIWRLPESYLCFTPPETVVPVSALPAITNGYVTFCCFNNLSKMNDSVVALWSRILNAVPDSQLLLKAKQLNDGMVRQSVTERYAQHGISATRLTLQGHVAGREVHLATYSRTDIALDPFPYPGITTSVEGMWMGVPMLSLAGDRFLSRQGVSLLMNAGLPEWIAADSDDYVAKAVALSQDLPRLAKLRRRLRQQVLSSPLFDARRFALHFESALGSMWERWCCHR